jgi:nucleoside-diphosphate-sugar epimerase
MKYVVTGGAGFIGSSLVRSLVALDQAEVVVIDNFLSGRLDNLAEVASQVQISNADIRDYDSIVPAFEGSDIVFHLAAIPSVPRSINDPVPSHEVNIDGTFNVYRAAQSAGARRLVYAGSSSAYGDTPTLPKVETMQPQPKSPYALQKLTGEYYASVFACCFGMEAVSLRFFNVYGPRQDPSSPYSGVLSKFITCILHDEPPTIHGDGEQTRDFTYVEDVVDLMLKASRAQGVSGKVYNAGNGGRYSLNQVWQTLRKITGAQMSPIYIESRAGDVRDSQADVTAAVHDLGHSPRFSLEEGLRRTFEWYRQNHS